MPKITSVNPEALPASGNLLQSAFWAEIKRPFGWNAYGFILSEGAEDFPLLVLVRTLGFGNSLAYVPHGPEIKVGNNIELSEYLDFYSQALKKYLPKGVFAVRYDLPQGTEGENTFPEPIPKPLVKAPADIQPPDTVIIDCTQETEEIMNQMKSKTRYNIRLAFRKGVEIEEAGREKLDEWYEMYQETAERDKIVLHHKAYYENLFDQAQYNIPGTPELKLLFAKEGGELLAGNIVAFTEKTATYLYGASTNKKRNLMPAYALQWKAIEMAKQRGCSQYDLFGIPPVKDKNHPMYGLYRFKTGFGGTILHRYGCYDYPISWWRYPVYRNAEKMRQFYFKSIRKRF